MAKFLDNTGLSTFWAGLKGKFLRFDKEYNTSEITSD